MTAKWVDENIMCTDIQTKERDRVVHIVSYYDFKSMKVYSVVNNKVHPPRDLFVQNRTLHKKVHILTSKRNQITGHKLVAKPTCPSVQRGFQQWLLQQIVT